MKIQNNSFLSIEQMQDRFLNQKLSGYSDKEDRKHAPDRRDQILEACGKPAGRQKYRTDRGTGGTP